METKSGKTMRKTGSDPDLTELRRELRQVDDAVYSLLAQRQELARKVGEAKLSKGLAIKVPAVEKEVRGNARARAAQLGLSAELCEEMARLLIRYSCHEQEEGQRRASGRAAEQKNVLIVGGLGLMGQWMARFLASSGHAATLWDTRAPVPESPFPFATDLTAAARAAQVIVLATPVSVTAQVIDRVAKSATDALVFDICSLKSPLIDAIERARRGGLRITSIHPLFGPDVRYLAGRNILFCDAGEGAACDEATALFKTSAANLVRIPIARHDELMRHVLGLSHLISLVFADTLVRSGVELRELVQSGSTSFLAQAGVTGAVVRENRDLYYEIQAENVETPSLLEGMRQALEAYASAIAGRDREGFKALMQRSGEYFGDADSLIPTE